MLYDSRRNERALGVANEFVRFKTKFTKTNIVKKLTEL